MRQETQAKGPEVDNPKLETSPEDLDPSGERVDTPARGREGRVEDLEERDAHQVDHAELVLFRIPGGHHGVQPCLVVLVLEDVCPDRRSGRRGKGSSVGDAQEKGREDLEPRVAAGEADDALESGGKGHKGRLDDRGQAAGGLPERVCIHDGRREAEAEEGERKGAQNGAKRVGHLGGGVHGCSIQLADQVGAKPAANGDQEAGQGAREEGKGHGAELGDQDLDDVRGEGEEPGLDLELSLCRPVGLGELVHVGQPVEDGGYQVEAGHVGLESARAKLSRRVKDVKLGWPEPTENPVPGRDDVVDREDDNEGGVGAAHGIDGNGGIGGRSGCQNSGKLVGRGTPKGEVEHGGNVGSLHGPRGERGAQSQEVGDDVGRRGKLGLGHGDQSIFEETELVRDKAGEELGVEALADKGEERVLERLGRGVGEDHGRDERAEERVERTESTRIRVLGPVVRGQTVELVHAKHEKAVELVEVKGGGAVEEASARRDERGQLRVPDLWLEEKEDVGVVENLARDDVEGQHEGRDPGAGKGGG